MAGEWMQREIEAQPAMLERQASMYAERLRSILGTRRFDTVVLAARGSSDNAALYARYLIEIHLQVPAILAAPSVLTRYGSHVRYQNALAIGISQSGATPDVAEVLAEARKAGHATLAITNTAGSDLARAAEHTLLLECGEERSVAATKTYTASLLALYQIARGLGADLPEPTPPSEEWLQACRIRAANDARRVLNAEPVFALGRGYSFATAHETALKLMECALVPCKAYSIADFEHGPKALAGPGAALISFDEVSSALTRQGARIAEAPIPPTTEEQMPIWQVFYSQCLALECARLAGQDPDKPQFIQKVTRTH
jgi:glucosamine--fructose-6-phosphate aminotransferase (isomerizing)